jgi:hypothetical protein
MSLNTINIPTNSSVFAVDAQEGPNKVLILPDAATVPGRYICIKDYFGFSGSSTFYISTPTGNIIDVYNSTLTISTSFQSMSFMSDGISNWATLANQVGPVPLSFSPTEISTPEIWFDASYLPNITYDTTNCNVTSWSNRGSIAVSADSNGAFNDSPKTFQYAQNGLNVITYNNDNGLRIDSMSLANSARTCFAVYKQLRRVFSRRMSFLMAQDGFDINDFSFFNSGSGNGEFFVGVNNGITCQPVSGIYMEKPENYNMISLVATTSDTGDQGVWLNASNLNSNFDCASENNDSFTTYDVGGGAAILCPMYNYAESLIFNYVMSTSERERIEGYLSWKWGLRNLLPDDHPYKNTAP